MDFHPDAKAAYARQAREILGDVKMYEPKEGNSVPRFDVHPSAVIPAHEIIGAPKVTERLVDARGRETGRFWTFNGQRFGWTGEAYSSMRKFAQKLHKNKPMDGLVSEELVLDTFFDWLCMSLEGTTASDPVEFLTEKIQPKIMSHEFCIPLHEVFSTRPIQIGPVAFRPMTRDFFDSWFLKEPLQNPEMDRRVRELETKTRASYQGRLGAWIVVHGEKIHASGVALDRVTEACSLLRFVSTANWLTGVRSYATPLGLEGMSSWDHFNLENGVIRGLNQAALIEGRAEWVLDDDDPELFSLLTPLSDLYQNQDSDFKKTLLEAMLIYSRNSTTSNASDKLLFIIVALESMLLRDASEPIQGNLAERMAFLIGQSLEHRKAIVADVRKVYGMRSKFVHHGIGVEDEDTLSRFLVHAWGTLLEMVNRRTIYKSRTEMLNALDEVKLS